MKRAAFDIETDGLDASVIFCACLVDLDTEDVKTYEAGDIQQLILDLSNLDLVVGHNLIGFDLPVLRKLHSYTHRGTVKDTLVLSHLLRYELEDGHSLEAWGRRLGLPKLEHADFSKYTKEMLTYCINDTKVSKKLYLYLEERLGKLKVFDKAIDVEHTVQEILQRDVKEGGYPYDKAKADYLRSRVMDRVSKLDELILVSFPPVPVSLGDYVPRLTKHGTIARTNLRWWRGNDFSVFTDGAPFTRLGWELFNPGSVKQIVQRLTDNGWWEPTERTDGYLEAQRTRDKIKLNKLDKYGWKLSEQNLSTLKETDAEELWVKECRVKIKKPTKNIADSIISEIKIRRENSLESGGGVILTRLSTTTSNEIMASVSKTMNEWLSPRVDAASFVDKTKSLWSITATPTGTLEACCASSVMDTSDGMNVTQIAQQRISGIKGARLLVERLALNSRLTMLDMWERNYNPISKSIHGTINGIGTWTHRCSHNNPNLANIATAKTIKYKNPDLARSVIQLGAATRSLFHAKGYWQVGVDADGIQLRLFAHYANDQALIEANVNGNKELGTDVHSLNKRALGSVCLTRDDAKTWIYAYLLGAGDAKLARILKCDPRQAKQAKENLLKTYRSINKLRKEVIPRDAARGYFQGLDGRYVCCSSEHLMLSGYLQNGEALVMKYAMVKWRKEIKNDIRLLTFCHDEWQTLVKGTKEEAQYVGRTQAEAITWAGQELGVRCPLKGNWIIGKNWLDCH